MNNGVDTQICVFNNDIQFHILLEHVQNQQKNMGSYRIILTQRGLCNDVFYDRTEQFCNIRNGYVKMSKHSQVMSFDMHVTQTDDHEDYGNVQHTMETLSLHIAK